MQSLLLGAAAATTGTGSAAAAAASVSGDSPRWRRGIENQRQADLGDGTFLNPLIAGDHADPSVLKDGADYYITHSSFDVYPGLPIRHSRDLVNWRPLAPALTQAVGSVWAPDFIKHAGRFYIYLPARTPTYRSIYVIQAERPEGLGSAPSDLRLPDHIDPGHAVAEDGPALSLSERPGSRTPCRRRAFRDRRCRARRRSMALSAGVGRRILLARRSQDHPWQNAPVNPLVRTRDAAEKWWSRGHARWWKGRAAGGG